MDRGTVLGILGCWRFRSGDAGSSDGCGGAVVAPRMWWWQQLRWGWFLIQERGVPDPMGFTGSRARRQLQILGERQFQVPRSA